MRLVVDANILFAALIKEGTTAEIIFHENISLFAPEFLFKEFAKYEDYILEKTHRSKENFKNFNELLQKKIIIVPKDDINPKLEKAKEISPDPKDTVYLALCLAINSILWSNDKDLKEQQDLVRIMTTKEIIDIINSIKSEKETK